MIENAKKQIEQGRDKSLQEISKFKVESNPSIFINNPLVQANQPQPGAQANQPQPGAQVNQPQPGAQVSKPQPEEKSSQEQSVVKESKPIIDDVIAKVNEFINKDPLLSKDKLRKTQLLNINKLKPNTTYVVTNQNGSTGDKYKLIINKDNTRTWEKVLLPFTI